MFKEIKNFYTFVPSLMASNWFLLNDGKVDRLSFPSMLVSMWHG